MAQERVFDAVDAAWLRMDRGNNPMSIAVLLKFEGRASEDALRTMLDKLEGQPKFCSKVIEANHPFERPRWQMIEGFAPAEHLRIISRPMAIESLERVISAVLSHPIDRDGPLWDANLYHCTDGNDVLFIRLSHALGDGVSLVKLLLSMVEAPSHVGVKKVGLRQGGSRGFLGKIGKAITKTVALAKLAFLPTDSRGPLKRSLSGGRLVGYSRAYRVDEIAQYAHRKGVKLNDVLLCAIAGALRTLVLKGNAGKGINLRAIEPVFLQHQTRDGEPSNHFGLVFIPLHLDIEDRDGRLTEIAQNTKHEKQSEDAPVAFDLLGAMGALGPIVERLVVDIFTRKASIMISNVPGPSQKIHFAGSELDEIIVWAPTAGHIGVSATIMGYAGKLRVAFSADRAMIDDVGPMIEWFEMELSALLSSAA